MEMSAASPKIEAHVSISTNSFCDIVINVALDRLASTPHLYLAPPPAFNRMCYTIDPPSRVQPRQLEGLLPAPAFAENSMVV